MKANNILQAICAMAADDNQGIRMSTIITDVKNDPRGAIVSFGVENEPGEEARKELFGLGGKYMVCCFFIDREEFAKYQKKEEPCNLEHVIGSLFLNWANKFFSDKDNLNVNLKRSDLFAEYRNTLTLQDHRFNTPSKFKIKLMAYCELMDYQFQNHKSGGVEWFRIVKED